MSCPTNPEQDWKTGVGRCEEGHIYEGKFSCMGCKNGDCWTCKRAFAPPQKPEQHQALMARFRLVSLLTQRLARASLSSRMLSQAHWLWPRWEQGMWACLPRAHRTTSRTTASLPQTF